jgi:hypothetical protein
MTRLSAVALLALLFMGPSIPALADSNVHDAFSERVKDPRQGGDIVVEESKDEEEQEAGQIVDAAAADDDAAGSQDATAAEDSEEAAGDDEGSKKKEDKPKPPSKSEGWLQGQPGGFVQFRYTEGHDAGQPMTAARDLAMSIGYTVRPSDRLRFHAALNTGREDNPGSPYVNPADIRDELWLRLDEYWVRAESPGGGAEVSIGPSAYPFDLSGIVYDNDLRFFNSWAQRSWEPGGTLTRVQASLLAAQLRRGNASDDGPARLLSARVDTRLEWGKSTRLDAALSYHDFGNVDTLGYAVANGEWRSGGIAGMGQNSNQSTATGDLASDFNIADVYLEWALLREGPLPVTLTGEYLRNLGAAGPGASRDTAWFAEVEVGALDNPGDWQLSLDHARIESESVLAVLNRGEYGTNYRGTRLQGRLQAFRDVEWRATYTWAESIDDLAPLGAFKGEELKLYLTYSW